MLIDLEKIIDGDSPNLVVVLIDSSSSMKKLENEVKSELKESKDFFTKLDDESVILLLRADFSGSYKEYNVVKPEQFDTSFSASGKSIFYYSLCRIRESLLYPNEGYVEKLQSTGYNLTTTLFVISDGKDEGSKESGYYFDEAKEAIADLNKHNVDTYLLLFGNNDTKIGKNLNFNNVHCFERSNEGLSSIFKEIRECSQSKITGENNWFNNI